MDPVVGPTAGLSHRYYVLPTFVAQPNFQNVPGTRRRGFFHQRIRQRGRDRTRAAQIKCNSRSPPPDTCRHNATETWLLPSTL